jgi:hypothetical protein
LSVNAGGDYRAFPPKVNGANSAWIAPTLAMQITDLARTEYELKNGGQLPNGEQKAA